MTSSNRFFTLPLIRYILALPHALPIEHIILGERPYGTNIFPYAASAMSYDPLKQDEPTPSVHYLALDMVNTSDLCYNKAVDWFRDSWKYLNQGVIALNVCTLLPFMSSSSEPERVALENFLRGLIIISRKLSNAKIHVYAMGNPARHSATRIRSSIANSRNAVIVHECNNPAQYVHKIGDQRSHEFTLKSPRLSKLLADLIVNTTSVDRTLTEEDYRNMSSGQDDLSNLVRRSSNMVDHFSEIEAYFKSNTGKTIDRDDELFGRAKSEMKEFVLALQSARIQALFASINEPKGTAKQSYLTKRQQYSTRNFTRGTSNKLPSTPGSVKSVNIGIAADNDEEDVSPTPTSPPSMSNPPPSTPKRQIQQTLDQYKSPNSAARSDYSRTTSRNIGFAEEEEEPVSKPTQLETIHSGNSMLNAEEHIDLSYVCDFISDNMDKYKVDPVTVEFLENARGTRRAASGCALDVLNIIRDMRNAKGSDAISDALGYTGDEEIDVTSRIVQWVMNSNDKIL